MNLADTKDNELLGSDEGYTLDADEFKRRIEARKKKLLEAEEKSSTTTGGSGAQPQTIDNNYPEEEGERGQ